MALLVYASPVAAQGTEDRITVMGVRLTKGDAVNCPQVRAADGAIVSVSYLAPDIAIGERVEISGFMADVTTCLGPVLYAEQITQE